MAEIGHTGLQRASPPIVEQEPNRILVAGNSAEALEKIERLLTGAGYPVIRAWTSGEILDLVRRERPELVLIRPDLPGIDIAQICHHIKSDCPGAPPLVVGLIDPRSPNDGDDGGIGGGTPDYYLPASTDESDFLGRIGMLMRLQKAERDLRRNEARLSAITAVQQEIAAGGSDQNEIMRLAAIRAQQLTGADGTVIELVEGDEFVYCATSGSMASQIGMRSVVDGSFSGLAIRTDQVLRSDDVEKDPRVRCDECGAGRVRSVVAVPLRHQYNSIGALRALSFRREAFDTGDVQTLQVIAHFMSAAINQTVAFGAKQALLAEHTRTIVALRESEERFRSAFDHAAIGMALVAPNGQWVKANRSLCEITGYSETEFRSQVFDSLTHPGDVDSHRVQVQRLLADEIGAFQLEERFYHRTGSIVWVYLSVSLLRDGKGKPLYFIAQIQDITERKRADEQIQRSLREKEVLLKEIHHRVKNNLQVISSLLRLQSGYVKDHEGTRAHLLESQNRVRLMALIHEKLYQSQDLTRIDFNDYVVSLVAMLYRSYVTTSSAVNWEAHVEPVFLNIDTAIPVGLLVNELVSNSLKYAFPGNRPGTIHVDFRAAANDEYVLACRDDGVGLPKDFDLDNISTLGLRLVKILTSQLGGELALRRNGGTEFTITFRAQRERERN